MPAVAACSRAAGALCNAALHKCASHSWLRSFQRCRLVIVSCIRPFRSAWQRQRSVLWACMRDEELACLHHDCRVHEHCLVVTPDQSSRCSLKHPGDCWAGPGSGMPCQISGGSSRRLPSDSTFSAACGCQSLGWSPPISFCASGACLAGDLGCSAPLLQACLACLLAICNRHVVG